jgi:conjugative transfer signal peptidase TraF
MFEERDLPLRRWGEALRRGRAARRARRARYALWGLAALAVTGLQASISYKPRPLLVWNTTESAPIGLYLVAEPRRPPVGKMVIAWPPPSARSIAAERRYLPSNVPLVKRVAAVAGDRACAVGDAVWVNGRHAATRAEFDGSGRRMPSWTGCSDLKQGDYLLLMDGTNSFDGRYFGLTRRDELVGRAALLWAR